MREPRRPSLFGWNGTRLLVSVNFYPLLPTSIPYLVLRCSFGRVKNIIKKKATMVHAPARRRLGSVFIGTAGG